MSGHTTGPWFVEQNEKTPIYVSPVSRYEQIAICNVMVIDEDPEDDSGEWFNGDQTKANARLIAAAPELLEALEAVTKMAIAGDEYSYADWGKDYVEDPRVTNAKAAIAKARGEA